MIKPKSKTTNKKELYRNVGCTSKRRYESFSSAQKTAYLAKRHYGTHMRPYRCPYCHGWHMTHGGR